MSIKLLPSVACGSNNITNLGKGAVAKCIGGKLYYNETYQVITAEQPVINQDGEQEYCPDLRV